MSTSTDSKYVLLIVSTDLVCPSRYLLTKLDCTVNAFNIMEQKTGMEVERLCEKKWLKRVISNTYLTSALPLLKNVMSCSANLIQNVTNVVSEISMQKR